MLPGYAAVLVTTPSFLRLVAVHRVDAVKQRLYVENLLEISVPVPPREEQERVIRARVESLRRIEEAKNEIARIGADVDTLIPGTAPTNCA